MTPKVYLAQSAMQIADRNGLCRAVAAGEVIEDFETWPNENQLCMLRLGRVKLVGGRYLANMSTQGGHWHFETPRQSVSEALLGDENEMTMPQHIHVPGEFLPPPALSDAQVQDEDGLPPLDAADAPNQNSHAQPLAQKVGNALGAVVCPVCKKVCKNTRGLVLHRAKAHGDAL